MINEGGYFVSLPEITVEIAEFIEYMKKNKPEKETLYEVMIFISLFHFNDENLDWIRESKENMDSFSMAWILGNWIVIGEED